MLRRCPAPLITMAAALAFGLGSQTKSSRADVTAPAFTVYNLSSTSLTDISQWTVNPTVQIKYDGTVTAPSAAPNPWDGSTPTTWLQYTLTTSQAIASQGATPPASSTPTSGLPNPQVLALDVPISILPSNATNNLLYVTGDSANYYTQNSSYITVHSGTTSLQQNGQPVEVQALGLNFYGQGLQAGQSVTFDLPFNASVVGTSTTTSTSTSTSTSSSGTGSSSASSSSSSSSSSGAVAPQGAETPEPLSLLVWAGLAGAGAWRRGRGPAAARREPDRSGTSPTGPEIVLPRGGFGPVRYQLRGRVARRDRPACGPPSVFPAVPRSRIPHEMRPRRWPIAVSLLLALGSSSLRCDDPGLGSAARVLPGGFLVRPYLQLGEAPAARGLRIVWQAEDVAASWAMEYRPIADGPWRPADPPAWRRIAVADVPPHRVYHVNLKDLVPGSTFGYRVRRGDEVVFEAEGRAEVDGAALSLRDLRRLRRRDGRGEAGRRAGPSRPARLRGDPRRHRLHPRPDPRVPREVLAGVRRRRRRADGRGAALALDLVRDGPRQPRHRVARPGAYPDGLAYFLYWEQPLNGPTGPEGGSLFPTLTGPVSYRRAFRESAGPAYPRMANFSFDYGNAHWTVLDSNPYVDWTDPELRAWLARDLESAKGAAWRFVTFHHPPFNSSRAHFGDQRMRLLVDVLEAGRVDVVWTGHVHNYQRTYPMTFQVDRSPDGRPVRRGDRVPGRWTLDTDYDGRDRTRPRGVIYVITGGGGADLYYPYQQDDPASWQPYTFKMIARVHSLTVADVDGPRLTVRQLAADGREVDRFVVTKDAGPPPVAAGR